MSLPDGYLDELTAKTDMVALVGQYVSLQHRGTRWFGCCPFHSEKTPSFHVTPDKGVYYCFGCQKGGGVVQFVMDIENLSFHEAVAFLASRAGLPVPEDNQPGVKIKRQRVLDINRFAARWFYDNLALPRGAAAVSYMQTRRVEPQWARRFGLGCAPDSWDALLRAARQAGISSDELLLSGLAAQGGKQGHLFDSFRNRLMFPIFDMQGHVIGFSGRALDDAPAKYKNSPETPVYRKRNTLYAAQLAKKTTRPYWILCEGNLDVLMLHQAGFDCAVAACGTALTDTQARLLARMTTSVVLAYDADPAGQAAAQKSVGILDKTGLSVRVLQLTGAKDPDEFLVKYGAAAFEKCIADAADPVEYRLQGLEAGRNLADDGGKIDYLRKATDLLSSLPDATARHVYAARVAQRLGITSEALLRDVERVILQNRKKAEKNELRTVLRRTGKAAPSTEEMTLTLLLHRPDLLSDSSLTAEDFTPAEHRALFQALREGKDAAALPETAPLAARLLSAPFVPDPAGDIQALADCVRRLEEGRLTRQAQDEGRDPLYDKFQRLKEQKKYGG